MHGEAKKEVDRLHAPTSAASISQPTGGGVAEVQTVAVVPSGCVTVFVVLMYAFLGDDNRDDDGRPCITHRVSRRHPHGELRPKCGCLGFRDWKGKNKAALRTAMWLASPRVRFATVFR